jgi:hypothetical protein
LKNRTTHRLLGALLCACGGLASSAHADQVYVAITGQQTGAFLGESPRVPNRIEALKLHQVVSTHTRTMEDISVAFARIEFNDLVTGRAVLDEVTSIIR